jgi:hypothetical protein
LNDGHGQEHQSGANQIKPSNNKNSFDKNEKAICCVKASVEVTLALILCFE